MQPFYLDNDYISLSKLMLLINSETTVELSDEARERVQHYRDYLTQRINASETPIYGINTGFGSLCNVAIKREELQALQINLVRSHACGAGKAIDPELVRIMLLLKAKSLCYGNSGARSAVIDGLCAAYNKGVYPKVFELGSLGASGDLAPLAHLSLPLLGEGEALYQNEWLSGADVLQKAGIPKLTLEAKEGLALLNGTQFMQAYAVKCLVEGWRLFYAAQHIAALSIEGFNGRIDAFAEPLHRIRPHKGQMIVAEMLHNLLDGSKIMKSDNKAVQDPYSIRCIPQVHGASYTALLHATEVLETEMNSVTDNPNIFPDEDQIISGGNFHGQHLALVLDYLAIALAELASIAERRIYLLVSGQRGLPPYLSHQPGTQSGFMIPQYAAASMVSQNKQLCTPASVDSIVSSNGQEDHVSMGANAATKCLQVVQNLHGVLGIELMTAAQALDFRDPKLSSSASQQLHSAFREKVAHCHEDAIMHYLQEKSNHFIGEYFDFPAALVDSSKP